VLAGDAAGAGVAAIAEAPAPETSATAMAAAVKNLVFMVFLSFCFEELDET
jgi:hypothetical protein